MYMYGIVSVFKQYVLDTFLTFAHISRQWATKQIHVYVAFRATNSLVHYQLRNDPSDWALPWTDQVAVSYSNHYYPDEWWWLVKLHAIPRHMITFTYTYPNTIYPLRWCVSLSSQKSVWRHHKTHTLSLACWQVIQRKSCLLDLVYKWTRMLTKGMEEPSKRS